VLALNWRSRYTFGEPPFTSLLPLGTSLDLRGLKFGQFRDFYVNYFLAEYRYKLYLKKKPTPLGFVAWGGVGSIGPSFNDALFKRVLPSVGIGVRFEVQPRLNMRADFGWAPSKKESNTATFFNFLESF